MSRRLIRTTDTTRVYEVTEGATVVGYDEEPILSPEQVADADATAFIRARFPAVLAKAQAIMADPVNATDFTANERKVINAVVVLDVAKRFRGGA